MREKICFVVQRYGEEVNGGAELQCREFAEHLAEYYDMEVLTSRAVDYQSWENVYPNDTDALNGVTIRRFPVLHPCIRPASVHSCIPASVHPSCIRHPAAPAPAPAPGNRIL
ncbi:MAG: hypothetical protein IKR61_09215, partial [Lachnospiraceae bacterium]|nr:hypothetical protein [Lachnospiraceae bacterium]